MLDNVVTDNIKTNKGQYNDSIDNDPTFYNNSFNLYSGTKDPLPVVTVSLLRGKKHCSIPGSIYTARVAP